MLHLRCRRRNKILCRKFVKNTAGLPISCRMPASTALRERFLQHFLECEAALRGFIATVIGQAAAGEPGFVCSPYAPEKGMLDFEGYKRGTLIECPFSGKHFRVP
jgi:hypothetical protein